MKLNKVQTVIIWISSTVLVIGCYVRYVNYAEDKVFDITPFIFALLSFTGLSLFLTNKKKQ